MKQLLLCRHAKSSWKDMTLNDIDRPLNKRGKKNAPEMGRRLAGRGIKPDRIITSPARRALKTARLLAKELGFKKKNILVDKRIYDETAEGLLDTIRSLQDDADQVMIVGHNPEITVLANILGDFTIDNVPTCGIVVFDFQVDSWGDIRRGKGKLVLFDYPRKGDIGQG